MNIPIVGALIASAHMAVINLRARVSNVRPFAAHDDEDERITFDLDGVAHVGFLRGRNRSLCVGFGEERDRAIAVRVLVDGDAQLSTEAGNLGRRPLPGGCAQSTVPASGPSLR